MRHSLVPASRRGSQPERRENPTRDQQGKPRCSPLPWLRSPHLPSLALQLQLGGAGAAWAPKYAVALQKVTCPHWLAVPGSQGS